MANMTRRRSRSASRGRARARSASRSRSARRSRSASRSASKAARRSAARAKSMKKAARKGVEKELIKRVDEILDKGEIKINNENKIIWKSYPIARLKKGNDYLNPEVDIICDDALNEESKSKLNSFLIKFFITM